MSLVAAENRTDIEAQIFYALALLANASPTDKTHVKQKQAADLLEPLYRIYPQHPGMAHYLIHAYDSPELASRGLPAARAYALIAPSAPHALHMPSQSLRGWGCGTTRLLPIGRKTAAHEQGDTGEELHAMDYLVYAYLQRGRDEEAGVVIAELKQMHGSADGRTSRSPTQATAMPVRYAVERGQWADAGLKWPLQQERPRKCGCLFRTGRAGWGLRAEDTLHK